MRTDKQVGPGWSIPAAGIWQDVLAERWRQLNKWGPQTRFDGTHPKHKDQADKARALCDWEEEHIKPEGASWAAVLKEEVYEAFTETEWPKLREELVQCAAVIFAWIEDGDARSAQQRQSASSSKNSTPTATSQPATATAGTECTAPSTTTDAKAPALTTK